MERLLFNTDEYRLHYNCTFFNFDAAIPPAERRWTVLPALLILWTVFLEVMYVPALYVMTRPKNFKQSCYKLMVYLGVVEVSGLVWTGIIFSYFMLRGSIFCSNPLTIYIVGIIGTCLWFAESSTSVILGLNRCLLIYNAKLAARLFDGSWQMAGWLSIPTSLLLWTCWTAKPILSSSIYFSPYFNPFVGFFDSDPFYYYKFYFYYNISLIVVLSGLYATFCVTMISLRRQMAGVNSSRKELLIFVQTVVICSLSMTAIFGYLMHEAYPQSFVWAVTATFGYVSYQGGPALIYLIFNSSVRNFIVHRRMSTDAGGGATKFHRQPSASVSKFGAADH